MTASFSRYPSKDIAEYIVSLVCGFAKRFLLSEAEAYRYIRNHHAIAYVRDNYGALHTLDFNEVLDCVTDYCRAGGGKI